MAYFLIIQDAATLTVTQVIKVSPAVVRANLTSTSLFGVLQRDFIIMSGKGSLRRAVRVSSSAGSEVQPTKVKRKANNGSSTAHQNGSKISDFFKPSTTEEASRTSVTLAKLNGVIKSVPTPKGSAKKHIIQVRTDADDVVLENGVHDMVTRTRRANTRRKVPFASSATVKDEPAQLSSVNSEATKIIPRDNGDSHKLTAYFPIRRSCRLTRSRIIKKAHSEVEEALVNCIEDGLKVEQILGKGRGIVATKNFKRGEFVVEYAGELITMNQARQREVLYAQDENKGCYMYYFLHNNRRYCVDATAETGRLGRLVNHSRSNGNLVTKTFVVGEQPHLILVAKRDIVHGEELLYDYGDRSKMSLEAHPWLAT